ncbi:helix-turn-helix domain-containing protein [Streptomyces malaysiensis]|uniref:helix-turn-helix domain-containing protein n=1 Tax=Streptomyces malaysiensis TaxID=92644 RepID=UPI000853C1A7
MSRPPRELNSYLTTRHFYGSELQRCRSEAEMTLEDLAEKVPFSRSQLHRVEIAETLPMQGLSKALDQLFGTGKHFERLYELVRQSPEIHPEQYRRRMTVEARARVISEYAGMIVPGLVQTEAYARALFYEANPRATTEEIDELVEARMSRQELLRTSSPPDVSVILDEAAVRRPVGGPEVMREQLARVADLASTPISVVQLLPFAHGAHPLLGGTLTLMLLDDDTAVAYEESIDTGTLLEDPESVTTRQRKYDLLRSHALSPSETASFIRSVMEAYAP